MKYFLLIILGIVIISLTLYFIFRNPFKYPYHIIDFDVSGKRFPSVNDYIDNYLILKGSKNE